MGKEWQYILGQPILWDEDYFVPRYPRHIAQAFIAIDYDDRDLEDDAPQVPYQQPIEQSIQQFAQRWDGLDEHAFLRALHEGRDRLAAIFALGCNSTLPNALDLLAPLLESAAQLERCAAACMFALRRDERAFSVLEEYLLHEPPKNEQGYDVPESKVWYKSHRSRIANVLATWGPPLFIPILRQACVQLWELEEREGSEGNLSNQNTQDALCYALGRRGALEAFHGITLPAQLQRITQVYLALGYVRAIERFEDLTHEVLLNKVLEQELTAVLVEHFALSEKEGRAIIFSWPKDIEDRRRIASYLEVYDDTPIVLENSEHVVEDILEIIRSRSYNTNAQEQPDISDDRGERDYEARDGK